MPQHHQHALMYNFEQAAQKLDVADAVLFRLCQTFKIPHAFFQNSTGNQPVSMPYKGDFIFSLPDIQKLQTIRNAIERGTPIKHIKDQLLNKPQSGIETLHTRIEQSKFLATLHYLEQQDKSATTSEKKDLQNKTRTQKVTPQIKSIEDVAQEAFNRYKHRENIQKPMLKTLASQLISNTPEENHPTSTASKEHTSSPTLDWMPEIQPISGLIHPSAKSDLETTSDKKQPHPDNKALSHPAQQSGGAGENKKPKESRPPATPKNPDQELSALFPKPSNHSGFKPWEVVKRGYHYTAKIWPIQTRPESTPVSPNAFRNNSPVETPCLQRAFRQKSTSIK